MSLASSIFSSPSTVFSLAFILRLVLLLWGIYQDAHSPLKYTDIDYFVFTDASAYLARGSSPYDRATYRYTPLLAWLLYPTTWGGLWFHFGKALFALSDIVAGWMIYEVLKRRGLSSQSALKYASVWLLNPMVANISTRGSSEGLLCVLVMSLLWAVEINAIALAGILLGASVHFKIYPFIYGVSMLWALPTLTPLPSNPSPLRRFTHLVNPERVILLITSLATFTTLNLAMYVLYGPPFLVHTFIHHLTRIDHRHNFSPYNTLLYQSSVPNSTNQSKSISFESLAFLPQLSLTTLLLPSLSSIDLPSTLLAQTLAFVSFNKVCTSQYFLWYLIFLPIYLPKSSLIASPRLGLAALGAWVAAQALWLQQGFQLEFLGRSTFVPGLWGTSLIFFGVNCWILGIVVGDITKGAGKERGGKLGYVVGGYKVGGRMETKSKEQTSKDEATSRRIDAKQKG